MPRTETAEASSSAAASSSAPSPAPLASSKRPLRDENGNLVVDWKDFVCEMVALLFGCAAVGGRGDVRFVWGALAVVAVVAPFVRRAVVGGPAAVVRDGVGWSVARVVGGVALFVGCLQLYLFITLREDVDVARLVAGVVFVAFGAVVDHLVRTPPEDR